jgi:hypothetical protein
MSASGFKISYPPLSQRGKAFVHVLHERPSILPVQGKPTWSFIAA